MFSGHFAFTIDDTRSFDEYKSGGVVTFVKQPTTVNFVRLPCSDCYTCLTTLAF